MASAEVQLSQLDHSTLDGFLQPHLRLEPPASQSAEGISPETIDKGLEWKLDESLSGSRSGKSKQNPKNSPKRSFSQTSGAGSKVSQPTVLQGTVESSNKRRPGILRRNSSKYDAPSPEPPDPNSEAKSVMIRRMQSNLEEWDKELQEICQKKAKNDSIQQSELGQKDTQIHELTEKYSSERETRALTEQERDQLGEQLQNTEAELLDHRRQVEQLSGSLSQYEVAYQELEIRRNELEQELQSVSEQLDQSENMRRRLNDQVTELQGQLAIEEQRSRVCVLL